MELSALPDDVLLHALSFLDTKDLLRFRRVCRRWRDLAVHPDLWRRRSVDDFSWYSWFPTALRVAPRMRTLILSPQSLHRHCLLLCMTTNCAANSLCLSDLSGNDLALATLVVARQAALGHLRKLRLELQDSACKSVNAHVLLQQVCDLQGLVELHIALGSGETTLLNPSGPSYTPADGPASLVKLAYPRPSHPYLPLLLAKHASTLEVVEVFDGEGLAQHLAGLPQLHTLDCVLLKDMVVLTQCSNLVDLSVTVKSKMHEDQELQLVADLERYLRDSVHQLKRVTLTFKDDDNRPEVVNLVLALAGQGRTNKRSALEVLKLGFGFDTHYDECLPPLQASPLAAILHRLPNLKILDLGGAPSAVLLDAIDTDAVPNLQLLETRVPDGCSHRWLHSAPMWNAFQRNPLLHIISVGLTCDGSCDFCRAHSCHKDMYDCDIVGFFAHLPEAGCKLTYDGYITEAWVKV